MKLRVKNCRRFIPQVLIPSEKVYEMRNGKKRIRERNFFPGYVLFQPTLSHGEGMHVVTSIPGVIGFLGNNSAGLPKILYLSVSQRSTGFSARSMKWSQFEERFDTTRFYSRRNGKSNGWTIQWIYRYGRRSI
jgi:transcription termination/antitermination protein NusG